MLEHDDDDRYITEAVFNENRYPLTLEFVVNSTDLFAHLLSCEKRLATLPSLIFLNYHASPLGAVDILRTLKENPRYRHIPVVVLSGTVEDDALRKCYEVGANSFITKPSSAQQINEKISSSIKYWFETVELPR